jgi:GNAT superfamily N-acetyltransferase
VPAIGRLTPEEQRDVSRHIVAFNAAAVPFTQSEPFEKIALSLRDDEGALVGGLTGMLYCWNCLSIDLLWIDEAQRGHGYGSQLLQAAEDEASRSGAHLSHLDTFDFQARDFYVKHGYEVFGELADCPPGHTRYYMKKVLRPASQKAMA